MSEAWALFFLKCQGWTEQTLASLAQMHFPVASGERMSPLVAGMDAAKS